MVLDRLVEAAADDIRVRRAESQAEVLRGFAETRYAAKSWDKERRVVARIEASASHADDMLRRGIDIRYVVTSLPGSDAEHIYETIYCARGQAENLIKQHKAQLASDRTSCRSPMANQMRRFREGITSEGYDERPALPPAPQLPADPYGGSTPADSRFREGITSEGYDERPALPPAPQLPADLKFGEYRDDERACAVDNQPCAAQKEYPREAQRARRTRGSVMAVVGLAMLATAGAFGYREMFGGSVLPTPPLTITASTEPHKIRSASDAPQAKNRGNASKVGADITGSIEKLVSREEQPVTIEPPKSAPRSSPRRVSVPATPNQAMPHLAAGADPRRPAATVAVTSRCWPTG